MELWMPISIFSLFMLTAVLEAYQRATAPELRERLRCEREDIEASHPLHRTRLTSEIALGILLVTGTALALTGNTDGAMPQWIHSTSIVGLTTYVGLYAAYSMKQSSEVVDLRNQQLVIDRQSASHWLKEIAILGYMAIAAVTLYAAAP